MARLEGPIFRPSSTSVFTLIPQHNTNTEDNMDWEAEWNELAGNKAWESETQLAGSTQITVQDFAGGGTGILSLPPYRSGIRSRSPHVHRRPQSPNKAVPNGHPKRNRTPADAPDQAEPADIQTHLIFHIKASSKHKNEKKPGLRQTSVQPRHKTLQMAYYLDMERQLGNQRIT